MIPRVLRNFAGFVNGVGYAGRIAEVELPEISVKTEEVRGGGQDGIAEVDMGLEAMSAKITTNEMIPEIMKLVGKMNGLATGLTFRGALQRDGERAIPCVCELRGGLKKASLGSWKAGDLASHEFEMSVRYFKLTIGEDEIYEIDVDNMVRRIGGVDEMESIRAAIGL